MSPGRRLTTLSTILVALLIVSTATVAAESLAKSQAVRQAIDTGPARNVILLIGDGMGTAELTAARNYAVGAGGRLALDEFLLTGQVTTYSVLETDPSAPDYDPESASTATAWSTGAKTADGRISTAPGTDADLANLVDLAEAAGMLTGNVSTAEITDATPAGPMSHVRSRTCQGPADMATCPQDSKTSGWPGSIAEQSIDHDLDVILGGGRARYEQAITGGPYAGQTVAAQARAEGYTYVTDAAGLAATGPGNQVLGLFTSGNMSMDWTGLPAVAGGTPPQRCNEDQRPAGEPGLAAMTSKALEILSAGASGQGRGQPGFFLQVESASIDKRDHAAQPCEQIGETINFDEAVRVALDFAAANPNTLVIATADHSHTSLVVESSYAGPGLTSTLITDEGQPMTVHYGTAVQGGSQQHTGGTVPIMATGPQAAEVSGLIDQTDIFRIITAALGL